MTSLLTPAAGLRYHRPMKKQDYRPVPWEWYQVLALHLAGKPRKEIRELTGYSDAMYYRILADERVVAVRQQLMKVTQDEFEALYQKVVDNIRTQLDHPDPQIQLAAQQQFFKATGKYTPKVQEGQAQLSAEELVGKLLAQQINVTVNLGGQVDAPRALAVIEGEFKDAND